MDGELRWRDQAPTHPVHADVTAPAHPSLTERHPATVTWGDLRLDPGLAGCVPGRARPTRIDVVHDGRPPWTLPLRGVLPTPLAWHPTRPLVAGLVVRHRQALPWTADYDRRAVTVLGHVRAATALTALGGTPLAWCAENRLALLVPATPPRSTPTPPDGDAPPDGDGPAHPIVLEASGPRQVTLLPGTARLRQLAAARVAVLDLATGRTVSLTRPLLVRTLRLAATARHLTVEHADEDATAPTATPRAAPVDEGAQDLPAPPGLRWRALPVPVGCSPALRRATARARDDGTPRGGPADLPAAAPPPSPPATQRAVLPGGARLLLHDAPSHTGPRPPALLWISPREPDAPPTERPPATVAASGGVVALLDLPVHWPPDATAPLLHDHLTGPLRAALARLTGAWAAHHDGRVAVGGHSLGATLALYALAHLPGLAAAIAHSGCYNRTLTPDGFVPERRTYWQVPEIYLAFSAVHFADRLRRPVLLLHGAEDTHPATPPEQAIGLYRAIVAAGGRARLVLLPHEGHTFHHRESLRLVTEEHRCWLARHAAPCPTAPAATEVSRG